MESTEDCLYQRYRRYECTVVCLVKVVVYLFYQLFYLQRISFKCYKESVCKISVALCAVCTSALFSVPSISQFDLLYKSFVLLLYISGGHCLSFHCFEVFSFCCHFSHSVLCCNRLVYSCFILFVKSDSNFNLNSSCQLFKSFLICLSPFFVYRLFLSFYLLIFLLIFFLYVILLILQLSFSWFLCYFFVTLSFLLFCLYVILSLLQVCLFFCHSVFFHLFVALLSSYFSFIFRLHFYLFACLFFDIST